MLPQLGFKKLNTDASWKNNAVAGGGEVIHNDDGSWLVSFSLTFHAVSPAAAELMNIREGLATAKKFNIHHLELELMLKL